MIDVQPVVLIAAFIGVKPRRRAIIVVEDEIEIAIDFDHDGDLDLVFNNNNGAARLYTNEGGNKNNWLNVRLVGTKSNRSGLDAVVRIESALGKQWKAVHSGSSYCSQSDLALTFGLAQDKVVQNLSVDWPSGSKQQFKNVPINQFIVIDETKGIVK